MEEVLHDVPLYCKFAGLDVGMSCFPDESTILRFRHLLEKNNLSLQIMATINATLAKKGLMLRTDTVVDDTIIAAPSSTKNNTGERDPEMHHTKKGNQWYFGIKAPHRRGCRFGLGAHRYWNSRQYQRCDSRPRLAARRRNSCLCGCRHECACNPVDARQQPEMAINRPRYGRKIGENVLRVSSYEFLMLNSGFGMGSADLPK